MEEIIKKWSETDPMLEATCVFECGELRQAISKIIEYGADNERLESLAEECGDVLICIDALAEKYKIDPKMRKSIIQKSIRLDERMKLASSGESDGKSAGYHKCINCKFYENFIGVCTCGDSEFRADYRDDDDVCEKWEGRYGEEKVCHKCINCNYYNEYHNNKACLKICIKLDPEVVGLDNICRFWKLKGGK